MDHVAETGLKVSQNGDGRIGARRVRRGLQSMDVQMIGQRVTRRQGKHPFEFGDQCLRARLRPAIAFPQVPWPQFRQRFCIDGADVDIGRIACGHLCHGFRERRVKICTADRGRRRVPRLERKDQFAFHRCCRIDALFCLA